ncbi:MAG: YafY family transcriptional regulator [bacterium]|nr:YafY family transcriptional regulator [bacterium]
MNRIDRLSAILVHLQTKRRVTMDELEERFELTRRTLFRDIKALLESGVPIGGDAGEGYFIVDGYHLPPVVFNKEEAAALLMGAKLIQHQADSKTNNTFKEALYKVKAVLRYSDKEYLERLEDSISILPPPSVANAGFPDSNIEELQYGIAVRKVLSIDYSSGFNELTRRDIEPLGLVYYSSKWHLIAYCRLREDLRDFRTDRIQNIRLTQDEFDPSKHPNYLDFLEHNFMGTELSEAVVRFTKTVTRFLGDQKYYHGFVEEKHLDTQVEMKFYTPSFEYFGRWLLSWGNQVEVVTPLELKDKIAELLQELTQHHNVFVGND